MWMTCGALFFSQNFRNDFVIEASRHRIDDNKEETFQRIVYEAT